MPNDYSDDRLRLVARLYYLDGLGQSEVAKFAKVSQAKVSRLLALAKERGIVRITVADYDPRRRELEEQLRSRLGLANVVVIKSSDGLDSADLRRTVGHFGAAVVDEMIQPRDTVALAGGRTIHELVHHLPAVRTKSLTVVQAMGSVDSSVNGFDAQEVGRVMAQRLGGNFLSLNTPAFIPDKRTRDALLELPQVRTVHEYLDSARVALVGLGTLGNSVFVERGTLDGVMIRELEREGAVGELCGRFIDANGDECDTAWRDRVISVEVEQLRKIPQVVGIVSGGDRTAAIQAAIRGKLIKALVIDEVGASALLAAPALSVSDAKTSKKKKNEPPPALFAAAALCLATMPALSAQTSSNSSATPAKSAATSTSAAAADWNIRDHVALDKIIIQGHRGVGFLAEENTIESFEMAWKMGIYPESDLRMTKDGVIVPFHDNNFARVVKDASEELKKKGVKDLTYVELSKLDVGSWRGPEFAGRRVLPMSTIFEMMRGHPERHLYMDIKAIEFPKLAAEIRKYGLEKQIVLASRKVEELRAWKALVPESETLLWMHGNEAELRKDLEKHRATKYAGITQLQIHVYPKVTNDSWAPPTDESGPENPFRLRNAFLVEVGKELRQHNVVFQTFPYTDDPTVYGKLLDLGVMSFATDHPDITLREIKAYYAAKKANPAKTK